LPGRHITRDNAPGAAGAQDIKGGVENDAQGMLSRASATGLRQRQQRVDQAPLCIRQRVGVGDGRPTPA
jgi:hypothetical protein